MQFRKNIGVIVIYFSSIFLFFTLPIVATAKTNTPPVLDTFTKIPWWGYLLIGLGVILLILLIFHLATRKKVKPVKPSEVHLTSTLQVVIPGNAQHIGSREEQQDAFGFSDISDQEFIDQYGVLAVLADGMGGLSGGKEVSNIAVQSFLEHYVCSPHMISSIPEKMLSAVKAANEAVLQFAKDNSMEGEVGTTLIASVIMNNQLYYLSVGDSRIYLRQGEVLTQITTDHIYGNELDVKAALGEITKEEAENDPQRGSLTSFLGLETLHEVDLTWDPIPLHMGDFVILCSDGLYGSISEGEMLDACHLPAQEAAESMLTSALLKQMPYQDNATVALLKIE